MIVAEPVATAVDRLLDGGVNDGQRKRDVRRTGGENALAHQFEETSINHRTFVVGAATVGNGDSIAIGRTTVGINALEVVTAAERSVCREGPVLYHALPVVGGIVIELLARGIAINTGNI